MNIRSAFFAFSVASLACGIFACASTSNAPMDDESTSEDALRSCALVRCASGTHCEVKKHKASCVADACGPNTKLCMIGYHYDNTPGVCGCVADAPAAECKTDANCRLEDDYCTGCDCRALAPTETIAACTGPGVRCFAEPCMNKTAACVAGQCVAR